MSQNVAYWMQGEIVQNFGDFLSQYLLQHLFFAQGNPDQKIRIIGSCIDDMFVPDASPGTTVPGLVFWGCGLRTEDGLSADRRDRVEILAVRGPLSRSALRLGNTVPIGDPGLLLPALHKAAPALRRPSGKSLLIPHFHDQRPDVLLLELSGCDEVLRPNVANDLTAIIEFIDEIVAARFVLAASLHGAIVAVAYDKPFAFWDSGAIDLPFKWHDFAASLKIPCMFQPDLSSAETHYAQDIRPVLQIPILWPLLVASPMPVRPDAFVSVIDLDVRRHGLQALETSVSSLAANRLQSRLQFLLDEAQRNTALRATIEELEAREAALRIEVGLKVDIDSRAKRLEQEAAELTALATVREGQLRAALQDASATSASLAEQLSAEQRARVEALAAADRAQARSAEDLTDLTDALAALQGHLDAQQADADRMRATGADALESLRQTLAETDDRASALVAEQDLEIARLSAREAWLAAEEARLHIAVQHRDHVNANLVAETDRLVHDIAAMQRSRAWRLGQRLRRATRRPAISPSIRRSFRLVWWTLSLQLPARLAYRRRVLAEIALIARAPFFDATFYQALQPDAAGTIEDAARHYVLIGSHAGADPNRLFDTVWYARTYPDMGAQQQTALAHYIRTGAAAGYDPHPLFESAWYHSTNPLCPSPADALRDYIERGRAIGAAPNRLFDPSGYSKEHQEAFKSGQDAFTHYLSSGIATGDDPHAFFDTAWYQAEHPEQAGSGLGPLAYYLRVGAALGHHCTPLQSHIEGFTLDRVLSLPEFEDPEASIIIPAYGHYFQTLRCLHAVMAHSTGAISFETILADDNPDNSLAPLLANCPGLRFIQNAANLGFLRNCNAAAALARGWHLVFLNNDTLVHADWLAPLLQTVRHDPQTGMVGCKLLNADGTIQEAGGLVFDDGWGHSFGQNDNPARSEYNYVREVDVVVGAAFLVRRELFARLHGFDERYAPAFYEEFDLAFEVRQAGYKVVYQPRSVVTHLGSASYGPELRDRQSRTNHAQFCLKWEEQLATQPSRVTASFIARQRPGWIGAILMIDDKVPEYDRHAGALTIFQYVQLLSCMGFRLIYAPADRIGLEPYTSRLQEMGVEMLIAPTSLPVWLRQNGRHLAAVWTARPDVSAPLLKTIRANSRARLLYYPHDLHYLRELRRYRLENNLDALVESNRVRKLEVDIFNEADTVMTPSEDDAAIIRKLVPAAEVAVIPPYIYSAGTTAKLQAQDFAKRADILFVGGFKHAPNEDAAIWLITCIMPIVWRMRPDAEVLLVGDAPTPAVRALASARVHVTGHVPDLEPWYARARLSVAPLRYGSGVKGKIVACLQAGIPVVTTGIGNEGIGLATGREVLIGETEEDLAGHILSLLDDDDRCAGLSQAASRLIDIKFSARRARSAILGILQTDICQVCGHASPVPQPNSAKLEIGAGRSRCISCNASAEDRALAEAILATVGADDAISLKHGEAALSHVRIHSLGDPGIVTAHLRAAPLFTSAPADASSDQDVGPAPGSCDLVIFESVSEKEGFDAAFLRAALTAVKPGGALILDRATAMRAADVDQERFATEVMQTATKAGLTGSPLAGAWPIVFQAGKAAWSGEFLAGACLIPASLKTDL